MTTMKKNNLLYLLLIIMTVAGSLKVNAQEFKISAYSDMYYAHDNDKTETHSGNFQQ